MARIALIRRNTKETQIALRLNLDGRGKSEISTGIPFFDHMLALVTRHGGFGLKLNATGGLGGGQPQPVEDGGMWLGEAVPPRPATKPGRSRAGNLSWP